MEGMIETLVLCVAGALTGAGLIAGMVLCWFAGTMVAEIILSVTDCVTNWRKDREVSRERRRQRTETEKRMAKAQ